MFKKYTLFLLIGCLGLYAIGQTPEEMDYKVPVLNDHPFLLSSSSISNPTFVNTQFDMGIGVGLSSRFEFPLFEGPNGPIYGVAGDLLFVNLGFRYKQRLKDWLAFQVSGNINSRVGTGVQSLLSQGFTVMNGSKIGWLVRLYENDKIYLSSNLYLNSHSGSFINISDFVQDIVDGVEDPQLSRNLTATTGGLSLNFAWGINQLIGFKALADVSYGETFSSNSKDGFVYNLNMGFDFNLYPTTRVPLGFYVGYDLNTFPEVVHISRSSSSLLISKIAYTGAENFQLGLEIFYGSLPLEGADTKLTLTNFTIASTFFF